MRKYALVINYKKDSILIIIFLIIAFLIIIYRILVKLQLHGIYKIDIYSWINHVLIYVMLVKQVLKWYQDCDEDCDE